MLVMILENVPASLKGALSRWLIEPKAGVFVGNPTARIRDLLWKRTQEKCRGGVAIQMWSHPGPQGYKYRTHNLRKFAFVEFEGLTLIRWPREEQPKADAESGSLTT